MSNVVINNDRNIQNQRISNLEQSRVILPFHIDKTRINKIISLFSRTKLALYSEPDKLQINSLEYNGVRVKPAIAAIAPASKMTLAKTYIATIKKDVSEKVGLFYNKVVEVVEPKKEEEIPVFGITQELNLQEAFKLQQEAIQEATTEIDLTELNKVLNPENKLPEEEKQVLSNNPLGETVIENPVNLNAEEIKVNEAAVPNVPQQNTPVAEGTTPVVEQPKTLVKSKKGNVLVIPIIVVWLGLVLFGTIKAVTAILS